VSQDADVGQVVDVGIPTPGETTFDVSLFPARETIRLSGGELIEMVPSRDGNRLEVLPYLVGQPRFARLVRDDLARPETNWNVGVHRPVRIGRTVTFEFSIQHSQRMFVPRPVEAWIEVTPVTSNGPSNITYRFYDANYRSQTSVPVLKWTVTDWPEGAMQANVQTWFRSDSASPTHAIPLKAVLQTGHVPDIKLATVPGVTYRIDVKQGRTWQIFVLEQHDETSKGLGVSKVALRANTKPTHIRHQFDDFNRCAAHVFEFSNSAESVLETAEILLTTRREAVDHAFRSRETILIDVTESSDLQKVTDNPPGQSRLTPIKNKSDPDSNN